MLSLKYEVKHVLKSLGQRIVPSFWMDVLLGVAFTKMFSNPANRILPMHTPQAIHLTHSHEIETYPNRK